VSADIEQIGGAPPTSLQQFLSENRDAFGASERPAA
jgi:hypothetical protein